MHQFDTDFGKLFYSIYILHQRQLISLERKQKLKDLLISFDEKMANLIHNLRNYSEQQVHEHLLLMVENQIDSNAKFDSEYFSDENQSIKSTRTLQLGRFSKPKLVIEKSTFRLAKKQQSGAQTTRQKRRTSTLKLP